MDYATTLGVVIPQEGTSREQIEPTRKHKHTKLKPKTLKVETDTKPHTANKARKEKTKSRQ